MLTKEIEETLKKRLNWKTVAAIPKFPLKNYEEVKNAFHKNKFSIAIDFQTANEFADWLYGKKYGYFFLLLTWLLFLIPLTAVILTFIFKNYFLLFGILATSAAFILGNPYFSYFLITKFFGIAVGLVSIWFPLKVMDGIEIAYFLVFFLVIPFWITKYMYYTNARKLAKIALKSEKMFIYLYEEGALTLKNQETKETYGHKKNYLPFLSITPK